MPTKGAVFHTAGFSTSASPSFDEFMVGALRRLSEVVMAVLQWS